MLGKLYEIQTAQCTLVISCPAAHIVSIDQGTNSLQRAEAVKLPIMLTTAGVPDDVAVQLTS